ncbi:MAG: VOC family protein, partial [Solirubrobacterales bacterium]
HGVSEYEHGSGYNLIALLFDGNLDDTLDLLADLGIDPERPPYRPGGRTEGHRICFVRDPDGYRIELIGE